MTVSRRSPITLVIATVLVFSALAATAGLAYLFLRGAPPAPVGQSTATPGASGSPASSAPRPTSASTLGPGGLDGAWNVDTSIGSFADFTASFAGYRVNETFTSQVANTAVGRTPDVSGSLTLAGTQITAVDVTADLTTLQSDDNRRDGQLSRQGIETARFPTATFSLTSPIELGSAPADGQTIQATATGDLTLHGVTKPVQVAVEATLSGDVVTVTGSIDVAFADFDIERPSSMLVLSIEDHGIMEFQLHFRHA